VPAYRAVVAYRDTESRATHVAAPGEWSRPGANAAAEIPPNGKAAISGSNDGRKMAAGKRTSARSGGMAAAPPAAVG
jgi:hypothetical protein